jgi:hypothetical protein
LRQWWSSIPGGMPNAIPLNAHNHAGPDNFDSQSILSSMRQWEEVARDVAKGLCGSTDNTCSQANNSTPVCVSVEIASGSRAAGAAFRTVLAEDVIYGLLAHEVNVYAGDYPGASTCDHVFIRTVVTQLNGAKHTGYDAGELTALAQGVLVARHVRHALSEGGVGIVALGELAYWLSPSYLTRHPMAEVAISVSQISVEGLYKAQYTNVYYIDAKDVSAYEVPQRLPKPELAALHYMTEAPEAGLPPVPASAAGVTKKSFTGTQDFGIGGATGAVLIGATMDGSAVFGNVQFADCTWHVAKMVPGGAVTDLGSMNGIEAYATSVSDDGKVIVGLVGLGELHATAFRWTSTDNGKTVEVLGAGNLDAGATVNTVLVSGTGTRTVANTTTPKGDRFDSWSAQAHDTDPLNIALGAYVKQNPSASCTVLGLSEDGAGAAILCRKPDEFYIWKSPAKTFGKPVSVDGIFDAKKVVTASRDLASILVTTKAGKAELLSVDNVRPEQPLDDANFVPIEISTDGSYVGGNLRSGVAALWNVWSTQDVPVKVAKGNHSAVAGAYLGGTMLLINSTSGSANCDKRGTPWADTDGIPAAFVSAPP